jgi:trans-2-enoyl-CoA reductase
MAPSDPSRMLMTGSDSASGLERIETSVTPTADAVGNMTEASGSTTNNVTNIYNTTNNNGGGSQKQPILVMPSSVRNNDNSLRSYQAKQNTR